MGLWLETKSSDADEHKVFIMACQGTDAFVIIPGADELKMITAEFNTYGRNKTPEAKSAPHSGVKLQATAKAHLQPRPPQVPPPSELTGNIVDSSTETSPVSPPVQLGAIAVKNTKPTQGTPMRLGNVLEPMAPWQMAPEPKLVNGCREGCHPEVQAKSDAGEQFVEVWFATASRESPYVEESEVRRSKALTKHFRHYHDKMSDTEIIDYDDLAAFLFTTREFRGYDKTLWPRLIRENMAGMREKPRLRWAFHVPQ